MFGTPQDASGNVPVDVQNANPNGPTSSVNGSPIALPTDVTQVANSDTNNSSNSQEVAIGLLRSDFTRLVRLVDASAQADGTTSPYGFPGVVPFRYNGASIDLERNNMDATLIASASYSTTQTSPDQKNFNGRGVKVFLNVGVIGAGSLVLTIQGKDPVSGLYKALLTSVAVVGNGLTVYTVYPGITATANVSASDILSRTWNVTVTGANGTTFSVGSSVIL